MVGGKRWVTLRHYSCGTCSERCRMIRYPHVGRWMIRNMAPTGLDSWGNGQIWHPRNDRTFRSKLDFVHFLALRREA